MKAIVYTTIILIVAGILSGCQPTPEKEPVVNRADGQMEAIVGATPVPQEKGISGEAVDTERGNLSSFVNAPWVDSFTYGDLVIEVNTTFEVGNGTACPVRQATKKAINPDWVNTFTEPFLTDATEMTGVEMTLEEAEANLNGVMKGTWIESDEGGWYEPYEGQEEDIAYWAQVCKEIREKGSPEWVRISPITKLPHNSYYRTDTGFMYRVGATERYAAISFDMDRKAVIQNETTVKQGEAMEKEPPGTTITVNGISQEEAEKIAAEAMEKAGIGNLQLSSVQKARAIQGTRILLTGWILYYELGGEACLPAEYSLLQEKPFANKDEMSYSAPWSLEWAYVFIDEDGNVRKIYVQDPVEFGEVLNENVAILSREEMQERIVNQLHVLCATSGGKVQVERVLLSGLLIQRPDSNEVWQVPSWVVHYTYDNGNFFQGDSLLLALNAIDGSVIHLNQGM